MTTRRRTFLGTLLGGWVVTAVGGFIYPVLEYLEAPPTGKEQKQVSLTVNDIAVGQAVQIINKGEPVIVIRNSQTEFTTLSAICTHLGCIVKWDEASQTLLCPCHGARFAKDGSILGGPPQLPLPKFPTHVENGTIVIGT